MTNKPKTKLKECPVHGMLDHRLSGNGAYICPKCQCIRCAESRRKNKRKLIEAFGGKCCLCGYDKYLGAFDFHHLNPEEKSFNLSSKGHARSIERLIEEAAKCILLCANCHREVEGGVSQVPNDYSPPDLSYLQKEVNPKKVVDPNWRTRPRPERRRVERPPLEQLKLEVAELGYCGVGRKYGVSDNAVRKWIKTYQQLIQSSEGVN